MTVTTPSQWYQALRPAPDTAPWAIWYVACTHHVLLRCHVLHAALRQLRALFLVVAPAGGTVHAGEVVNRHLIRQLAHIAHEASARRVIVKTPGIVRSS